MAPERNRLSLRCSAREENVAVARALVAAVAATMAFTLPEVEELRIATSEAVSNAVLHAYRHDDGGSGGAASAVGEIEMALDAADDLIRVSVRDWGRGIADVEAARRPEMSTLEGHLGLGFAFMQAMAEDLSVTSRPGEGTTVSFVKRAAHTDEADTPGPLS